MVKHPTFRGRSAFNRNLYNPSLQSHPLKSLTPNPHPSLLYKVDLSPAQKIGVGWGAEYRNVPWAPRSTSSEAGQMGNYRASAYVFFFFFAFLYLTSPSTPLGWSYCSHMQLIPLIIIVCVPPLVRQSGGGWRWLGRSSPVTRRLLLQLLFGPTHGDPTGTLTLYAAFCFFSTSSTRQ